MDVRSQGEREALYHDAESLIVKVYNRYYRKWWRQDSEDLFQKVRLALWAGTAHWNPDLSPWYKRAVAHIHYGFRDALRDRRRSQAKALKQQSVDLDEAMTRKGVIAYFERKKNGELVDWVLTQLRPRSKKILELLLEGKDFQDVADECGHTSKRSSATAFAEDVRMVRRQLDIGGRKPVLRQRGVREGIVYAS